DAPRLANLGAEGSRRHPRVRGARLDAGPRRSTRPRALPRHRPPRSARWRLCASCRGCDHGSARLDRRYLSRVPGRIDPARLRRASHSFFKNIAEVITVEIAGRMYADRDREIPAETPGFLLPSPRT